MIDIGRLIAGRYRLDSRAGAGGMGAVYRAHDMVSGETVALKLLHENPSQPDTERFAREAGVLATLRHPRIVAYHDHGVTTAGEPYLVMDWLSGEDLAARLRRSTLRVSESLTLLRGAAEGLAFAHEQGVVHRDIKPNNLFLRGGHVERVTLMDFGIARIAEQSTELTTTGFVIGTPAYMAPEQARGEPLTGAFDVFSLGCVLFECLTGQIPFTGSSVMAILAKLLFQAPPRLREIRPELPTQLEVLLDRMLARDPADRLPDAKAILAELDAFDILDLDAADSSQNAQQSPERAHDEQPPISARTTTAALSEAPTEPSPPPPPPRARRRGTPEGPRQPYQDLKRYLEQAGLSLEDSSGPLLAIHRTSDCRLPDLQLSAILLEPEHQPLSTQTLSTIVFQKQASPLYALQGTLEEPHHVLALFRSPPGAGVYREWHELATRRHVYVSPVGPSALRAAVEATRAAAHLLDLLRRARRDPFDLEGRVANEIDFFGSREELRGFLHQIDGAFAGLGLFGLEKWGTTSLLLRFRAEIGERRSAFIDLAALPSVSLPSLLSVIHEELASGLRKKGRRAPPPPPTPDGGVETALQRMIEAASMSGRGRPVIFLDRVDELSRADRCPPGVLIEIARALYRLAFPQIGRTGAFLVFGGREDHFLASRMIGAQNNPLSGAIAIRYAPFFSREEMGDFMQRLGALCGLSFSQAALNRAFSLTGGHKYLSRRLGSLLHQRQPAGATGEVEITPELVSACAVTLVTRHHDYFDTVVRRAPPALREVLALLVTGPTSPAEILRSVSAKNGGDTLAALKFADDYRLVVEDQGRYRLTVGLFKEWLGWTHDPERKPERSTSPPPATPSDEDLQWLEARIREGFSSPYELEMLARSMRVAPAEAIRTNAVLPVQVSDLVDWAMRNRRFWDLRDAVQRERPRFFQGGIGQTVVMPAGGGGAERRSGQDGTGT